MNKEELECEIVEILMNNGDGHTDAYKDLCSLFFTELKSKESDKDITDKQISDKVKEHELYHLKGMTQIGMLTPEFASMCCGNSFYDGIKWYKAQLIVNENK